MRFEIRVERNIVQTNVKLSVFSYNHKHYKTNINLFRNNFKKHLNDALQFTDSSPEQDVRVWKKLRISTILFPKLEEKSVSHNTVFP
jgi:uncharacterized membrane protein